MISRYSNKEFEKIWSEENKFATWLKIEVLVCEALNKLKIVSDKELALIKKNARFDVKEILESEKTIKHDVIAFTRNVSTYLGEEKKWIHYGMTSSDLVDTSWSCLIKEANELIHDKLWTLLSLLKKIANQYKYTPIMGRTHGIHAEVTTFGYKVALWYDILSRQFKRFIDTRNIIEVGMISGAVGNYFNVDPYVQEYVCDQLNINSSLISSQILQRDRHASYMSSLATIASVLEQFSVELRHLQRSEVKEVEEGFNKGQKGSSAMPHKKNPITAENITGLARVIRGYMVTAFENIALWHERDISHSSTERIIIPDATTLIYTMLMRFTDLLSNLKINEEQMLKNIEKTYNLVFSGKVLSAIIDHCGWSREKAYDYIQDVAMSSYQTKTDFFVLLQKNNCPLSEELLMNIKNKMLEKDKIDLVFRRLKI